LIPPIRPMASLLPFQEVEDQEKAQKTLAYPRKCPYCHKSFPTSTRYHKHVNYHTAEKKFKCDHPGCTKAYKRKVDLDEHQRSHLKVKPFRCTVAACDRTFATKQSLMAHMCVHNGLSCSACGLRFRKKAKLQQHWDIVHAHRADEVDPGKCPDCGKTFQHRASLERHILAQHPREGVASKQYKCTGCEDTFPSFLAMVRHRREKHPKTHKCQQCGFVTKSPAQLRHHQDMVHGEVMVACQHKGCPQTFTTKPAMKLHYRVAHLGLKQYKCRRCDKSFAYKAVLRNHCEKVHKFSPSEDELKPCKQESLSLDQPIARLSRKASECTPDTFARPVRMRPSASSDQPFGFSMAFNRSCSCVGICGGAHAL